ncbi:MAG TPA: hypothetical protein DGQ94_15515 [Pseudomonas sp.]|nr:hypothetical protein [Pseudomonas sp.]
MTAGAALQPFRDTRPLLQKNAIPCRSGLVSRKEGKALPCGLIGTPTAAEHFPADNRSTRLPAAAC